MPLFLGGVVAGESLCTGTSSDLTVQVGGVESTAGQAVVFYGVDGILRVTISIDCGWLMVGPASVRAIAVGVPSNPHLEAPHDEFELMPDGAVQASQRLQLVFVSIPKHRWTPN